MPPWTSSRRSRKSHSQLVQHILAPCYARKQAGLKPICPEGERFCGVKVWESRPTPA